MTGVVELDYVPLVDIGRVMDEYARLYRWLAADQINCRKPEAMTDREGISYGVGTLYDMETMMQDKFQEEFNCWCDYLVSYPALAQMLVNTVQYINKRGLNVGRVRVLTLKGKSNLTYHVDSDSSIRYHIPLITNNKVFFIVDDRVERMLDAGKLYSLDVQKPHTVVNASRHPRVHVVFDCYQ